MSVTVTISLWWLLWLYVAGAVFWAAIMVKDRPWDISGRGKPPFDSWQYQNWGIPIAWTINVVLWPWVLVRNAVVAPIRSRRRTRREAENWREDFGAYNDV